MAFGEDFWEVHDEKHMEVIEYLTTKMMEELQILCQKEKRKFNRLGKQHQHNYARR